MVKNNNETIGIRILNDSEENKRVVLSRESEVNLGDLIDHKSSKWLVTELPINNRIYDKTKMTLCNEEIPIVTETVTERVQIGTEPWGEPKYEEQTTTETDYLGCVVENVVKDYETGEAIALPSNTARITTAYTDQLKQGDEVTVFDTKYTIKGIDKTKIFKKDGSTYGILILNVETV